MWIFQLLGILSDALKLEGLASYFFKKYEASKQAHTEADAPLTNQEELDDIQKLP